jgi:hypothetical protein
MGSRIGEGRNFITEMDIEHIVETLNMFGGDVVMAAEVLEVDPRALSVHIYRTPKLRALFIKDVAKAEGVEPDEVDAIFSDMELPRQHDTGEESQIIKSMQAQNLDLLTGGLERSGISKKTIDKLNSLGTIEKSAASFLVASLECSHRMVVYQGASLFEQAETIKEKYLDPNAPVSAKERIVWQRLYNQITDQIGKTYDRVLNGTTAMVKLTTPKEKGEGGKSKPGFRPLKKAKRDD